MPPTGMNPDWFFAGLASSFPDVSSGDDGSSLSELYRCDDDFKPGYRVFHVPRTGTSRVTELEAGNSDARPDLRDQVIVFKYNGKFHAIDHVSVSSNPLSHTCSLD